MWFQVDEDALKSVRINRMARRLGLSYAEAFLACCKVWHLLYASGGGVLDPADIEAAADVDDFAAAMLDADLAEATAEGLRIKGSERAKNYAASCEKQGDRATKGWETRRGKAVAKPRKSRGSAGAKPRHDEGEPPDTSDAAAVPGQSRGDADLRKSSPTVKTGSLVLIPSASSQPPDPERAPARSPLAYTCTQVYESLSEAMGGLFVAEMPGGEKVPEGMAIQVNKALRQAGDAGYTLEQIGEVGAHTAAWMRENGATQPLTPAWVATTDVNKPGLLRGLVKLAARGGGTALARASPPNLTTRSGARAVSPQEMAERARRTLAEERKGRTDDQG